MRGGEDYWDKVAPVYNELYKGKWSLFENSITKSDLETLLRKAVGKRILDIGCGTGLGFELLGGTAAGIEYVGLDISAAMLRELSKRHPTAKIVHATGDSLAKYFEDLRFDIIISINVTASFPADTQGMLRDVYSLLAPGGLVYLSFLNRYSLRRLVQCRRGLNEKY